MMNIARWPGWQAMALTGLQRAWPAASDRVITPRNTADQAMF